MSNAPSQPELQPAKNSTAYVQLFRYAIVGGVAFVADFGLLFLLTHFGGVNYLISAAVGFMVGLVINYRLSVTWVFDTRAIADRRAEFAAFTAIGLGGVLVNELIMWFGVHVLHVYYLIVKLVAAGVIFLLNFSLRKIFLFSSRDRET